MAFPTLTAQQETNRKILEELQIKKQLLQKGVSSIAASAIPPVNTSSVGSPNSSHFMPTQFSGSTDSILSATARTAFNQANAQSLGFFIPQDSLFGNNIIPVLPRFDNPSTPQPSK